MNFPKNLSKIMGLSPEERAVLQVLETFPQRASDIQKRTGLPRATLDRILNTLHKRFLVGKHKYSSRRGGWVAQPIELIESAYDISLDSIQSVTSSAKRGEIVVYQGKKKMLEAARTFILGHAGERAKAIQSNKSWDTWATKLGPKALDGLNSLMREKMVIMETIFPDNFIQEDLYNRGAIIKGYQDRPSIAHVLPAQYFDFYSDLTICDDAVFIMNWKDELAVEIRNEDFTLFFKSIFSYMQDTAPKVNLHAQASSASGKGA